MVIRSGEETIGLFLNHVKFEMRVGNDDLDNGDVSMFAKVHALNLTDCKSITDVSTLVNVHALDFSFCKSITDVSSLGNVYILNSGNVTPIELEYADAFRTICVYGIGMIGIYLFSKYLSSTASK
eukprot:m.115936 g.115936  ORF g.115936 m.115936 type:complete len:125 (+) comp9296_c3_seq16:561-935(+)